jgi:hypothetical protein
MEFDAFSARLGVSQGRVEEAEDNFVFILGDLQPGYLADFEPGDRAEVAQDVNLTGADLVRAKLMLSIPTDMPSSLYWEAAILIDGVKHASAVGRSGRTRSIEDLAANVSKMSGVHTVAVRLQLQEE